MKLNIMRPFIRDTVALKKKRIYYDWSLKPTNYQPGPLRKKLSLTKSSVGEKQLPRVNYSRPQLKQHLIPTFIKVQNLAAKKFWDTEENKINWIIC